MKIFSLPPLTSLQTLPSSNSRAQEVSACAGTRLVDGAGERKLTLSRYTNGAVEVVVSPPPPTQLILSGGGAKGIAFPGVVQALETAHELKAIQVISGSSAGAISAALLASGMNAEAFDTLSDSIWKTVPPCASTISLPLSTKPYWPWMTQCLPARCQR